MLTMDQIHHIRELYYEQGITNLSEIAQMTGYSWNTVKKYVEKEDFNTPKPQAMDTDHQSKLAPFKERIDTWLEADKHSPRKQRHTAKKVFNRLSGEVDGFNCSYRTVAAYVARRKKELRLTMKNEAYIPLLHRPGSAQADFGQADFLEHGRRITGKYFVLSFPHSNAAYIQLNYGENLECLLEALRSIFEYIGSVPNEIWFDNASAIVNKIIKGSGRIVNDRFMRFSEHYRFKAVFMNPESGWEKKLVRSDSLQTEIIQMGYMDGRLSLAQNVDKLFFSKGSKLQNEYDRLFDSVFVNPDAVKSIVEFLATRNAGYTRKEIIEKQGASNGGRLSRNLNALIASDFVTKYVPFGFSKKEEHYKLIDPFCLFYLRFVKDWNRENEKYWQQNVVSQPVSIWRGFAFENVCFNHIDQIKKALGIQGVNTTASAWSKRDDDKEGAQIDLLISRKDNVINMCEIKFYGGEFTVNKEYYQKLLRRQELLMEAVSPRVSIRSTLITTYGLEHNEYV